MIRPSDLMLLYDGELSEKDAQRLARLVAEDPHAARILRELEHTGNAVRAWAASRESRADGIADRVLGRLAPSAPPSRVPRRRRTWTVALGGALALAAGIVLLLRMGTPNESARGPIPSSTLERAAASTSADQRDSVELGSSASIELVDFGGNNGTIFLVSSSSDAMTPVVWLADDPDSDESRAENL